jgi:hypothetical protein
VIFENHEILAGFTLVEWFSISQILGFDNWIVLKDGSSA